jgi:hypothetical protein
MFNALNILKEWNSPQKHCTNSCFNYGNPDHGVPKCPKPIDQARIDKANADFSRNGGGKGDKVAVLTVAVDRVMAVVMVINPTPMASGRVMIKLHRLSPLLLLVVSENIRESGAWHARLAGGIPPILQDSMISGPKILMHFSFLLPTYSGLSQERNLPLEVVEAQLPLPQRLSQLLLEALNLLRVGSALALGRSLLSTRQGQRMGNSSLFSSTLKGF